MSQIFSHLDQLIGQTPLLRLARLDVPGGVELLAKLENFNPSGSNMDRAALAMVEAAESSGALAAGSLIVEPTSGNVAFSLALVAVPRGYRVALVMPESVPPWRVALLRAMGADVRLTPAAEGMRGAVARATALAEDERGLRLEQFSNPHNAVGHARIADELWSACEGRLAAVVIPVSTGGEVSGLGPRLRDLSAGAVRIVAVEPAASPVLSGGEAGAHRLLGMGPPFVPPLFAAEAVDELVAVSDREARAALLALYRREGLMSGPQGGAALAAALRLAGRASLRGQRIALLVPDSIERYSGLDFWQAAGDESLIPLATVGLASDADR